MYFVPYLGGSLLSRMTTGVIEPLAVRTEFRVFINFSVIFLSLYLDEGPLNLNDRQLC